MIFPFDVCLRECIYVCMSVCLYVCVSVFMYVCITVCAFICRDIYVVEQVVVKKVETIGIICYCFLNG